MKICFVYPRFDWFEYNGLAEPIGLLILINACREAGFSDVHYIDYSYCNSIEEHDRQLRDADIIAVAISAAAKLERAQFVTRHMRKINPRAIYVAGGAYPSIFPADTLADTSYFDYAFVGESEISFVEFLSKLHSGQSVEGIAGLAYRDKNGDIQQNGRPEIFTNIDDAPLPARELVNYDWYLQNGMYEYGIVATRGCPFKCIYCKPSTDLIFGGGIRKRSPENVVAEILALSKLRKTRCLPLFFKDDTITLQGRKWFEKFRDLVKENNLDLHWHCNTRVDAVTEPMLVAMKESGCHCISFGIESGSDRILQWYQKGTTKEQAVRAFNWCHAIGIEATANLMIGCPIETPEDLEMTYQHLKELKPDDISVYFSTAIPGRKIYDYCKEHDLINFEMEQQHFDPSRNRAFEVTNLKLPFLTLQELRDCKKKIERYRSFRKMTSLNNISRWAKELMTQPGAALTKAKKVLSHL